MSQVGTKDQIKSRLDQWRRASEHLKSSPTRPISTEDAIACFDELFENALETSPKRTYTGLQEQQAWFKKALRRTASAC